MACEVRSATVDLEVLQRYRQCVLESDARVVVDDLCLQAEFDVFRFGIGVEVNSFPVDPIELVAGTHMYWAAALVEPVHVVEVCFPGLFLQYASAGGETIGAKVAEVEASAVRIEFAIIAGHLQCSKFPDSVECAPPADPEVFAKLFEAVHGMSVLNLASDQLEQWHLASRASVHDNCHRDTSSSIGQ